MHKPVDRGHSPFLNQQWIRRLKLSGSDFLECGLQLGNCRPHLGAQLFARQILRSEFSFTISLILGFAERSANEMTEIAGEMKNECAGGIGYARSGLPQRSIVRISGDLTIDSAQLT